MTSAVSSSSTRDSLETRIGSRWLLYAGVIALVMGAAYFVKLALENHWITPAAQVSISAAIGVGLMLAGSRFARAGQAFFGQMVMGSGVAVLYVAVTGAFSVYHLIAWPVACVLMGATTIAAAYLADTHRAQGLALIAVGGGLATPFLLDAITDTQVPLFTYDLFLVTGTAYLSRRRVWPALNVLSYVLTIGTLMWWAEHFYRDERWLVTEAFVCVFGALSLRIVWQGRRVAQSPLAVAAWFVLCTAPFACYWASLGVLSHHDYLFVIFLGACSAAGALLARRARSGLLFLLVFAIVTDPLFAWVADHANSEWLTTGLMAVVSVYGIFLAALVPLRGRRTWSTSSGARAIIHLNGLAAAAQTYLLVDAVLPGLTGLVTAMWAALHVVIAAELRGRYPRSARHFLTVGLTLLCAAIALQFDGLTLIVGWAGEGAAVAWLGWREHHQWWRRGGLLLFLIAVVQLAAVLWSHAPIDQLLLLNRRAAASAFVIALTYALAWLHDRQQGPTSAGVAVFLVLANVLTLAMLTSETEALWQLSERATSLRELTLSLTWVTYATALTVIGIRKQYRPIRYLAIVVLCTTIAKVLVVDLSQLDQLDRVLSVAGLGVMLLTSSYCYQRSRAHVGNA